MDLYSSSDWPPRLQPLLTTSGLVKCFPAAPRCKLYIFFLLREPVATYTCLAATAHSNRQNRGTVTAYCSFLTLATQIQQRPLWPLQKEHFFCGVQLSTFWMQRSANTAVHAFSSRKVHAHVGHSKLSTCALFPAPGFQASSRGLVV